jgi:hypothetical protein
VAKPQFLYPWPDEAEYSQAKAKPDQDALHCRWGTKAVSA